MQYGTGRWFQDIGYVKENSMHSREWRNRVCFPLLRSSSFPSSYSSFTQPKSIISRNTILCSAALVQFGSVTQLCPTLCKPMVCSTPGLPVHHQLPESTLLLPKATHSLWDKYKSTVGHTSPTIYYTIIARLLHLSLYKLELSDYSISSMPIMMNHMLLPLTLPCLSLTNHDLPDPYLRHSSEHPQTLSELCSDSTRGPCWPHSTLCCLPL